MTNAISRALLGKIVDEIFGGAIEDASAIEEIFAVIKREEAALSAAESVKTAPSVAVKALEWTQFTERSLDLNADSIEGAYVIRPSVGNKFPVYLWVPGIPYEDARLKPFNDVEAAKAAAQSHHDALIRSALSAQVQDVEGWQLVPKEPTEEMISAWMSAFSEATDHDWKPTDECPSTCWTYMLAAAPAKQEGEG